mmetsp:Transcript_6814/g.10985  ORF Transcript_6814/g.10985 Transcript_6814/m.10985 type:complete len:151 (-) Transcript_6814:1104-1556(-)
MVCDSLEDLLENRIFSFKDKLYDQPAAARLLMGMAQFFNGYSAEYAASSHMVFVETALQVLLNCPSERVARAAAEPVESDEFELGLTDNIFDLFYPHELTFDAGDMKEFVESLKHSKWGKLHPALARLTDLDEGATIKTTKDPRKISRLE